jgi:hypothetical protein
MNRAYQSILLLLLIVGIISCNSENDKSDTNSSPVSTKDSKPQNEIAKNLPEIGSLNGDTINLSGHYVVFYGPEGKDDDLVLKQYKETVTIIIDSLKKAGDIPVTYTTVNNFRVFSRGGSAMILSRAGFSEDKGVLVMDGLQPPTIKKGSFSVTEYHAFIKKYFLRP